MKITNYSKIANEYYDPKQHPTCAAFRKASLSLLNPTISNTSYKSVVELGCGRSVYLDEGAFPEELFLVDSEPDMLSYSRDAARSGVTLIEASAFEVPLPSGKADLVISSLGDPYNTSELWREVSRLLRKNGVAVFTTPSYFWSQAFRQFEDHDFAQAIFTLKDGSEVSTPSFVFPEEEQIAMIELAGLGVQEVLSTSRSSLFGTAPKLSVVSDTDCIVTMYLATKND